MISQKRPSILLVILLALCSQLDAQRSDLYQIADSLITSDTIEYFFWEDTEMRYPLDTVPAWNSHHYKPHMKTFWSPIDLGNNGSETRPVKFDLDRNSGLRMGYHGFDSWRFTFSELPIYNSSEAYTNLMASQGSSFAHSISSAQDNAQLEATFNRDFSKKVNALVKYRKVTEEGLLLQDDTDHTQFVVRLNQSRNDGKLYLSGAFIRNVFNRHENGGIKSLQDYLNENFSIRRTISINQPDATLRDVANIFNFGLKLKMASGKGGNGLFLNNLFSLENREYKYSDSRADALDSTYTKWVNHPSALRHYWSNRSLNNNTSISWKSKWVEKISTGLKYSLIEINDSESKTNLHYAALYGEVQAQLGSFISFQSRASVELLEEAGDFDLSGDLAVQWGDIGQLSGHLSLGLQSPEYYQLNLVFNGEKLWDVALSKTEYLQLGGNLSVDALNIDIEANQFVLNDWIYFNSDLDWTISDDVLTLSQIGITSDITFGSFYLKNGLLWQSTDAALVTVPEWFTRHIIYYQNRVFKRNMLLRVGLEGNIIIQDNDPTFIPIINHFSPGSNLQNDLSYRVDPFLHAKVKSLELVLKAENIESLWTDIPFVYAEGYPYNDWIFRLQINWRMMK